MNKVNKEFIIEKAEDLSFDPSKCPLSMEIRNMLMQYSTKNPILDNGQMICLKYNSEIEIKISTHLKNMLVEFIESEKNLEECNLIKNI